MTPSQSNPPSLGAIRHDIREICREEGVAEVFVGIVDTLVAETRARYPGDANAKDLIRNLKAAESWCVRLIEEQQGRAGK